MPRLIRVFAGRTCHLAVFVMRRLICGTVLFESFRSDCVLKYELNESALSLSFAYIMSFAFKGETEAFS